MPSAPQHAGGSGWGLDSLVARLSEASVRRVLEPVLAGSLMTLDPYDDDVRYVRDLGLIAPEPPVRIANPLYREVITRVLAAGVEENVTADPRTFVLPDGRLDFDRLLREFADFWREHGEILANVQPYREAAPHLVLMGFSLDEIDALRGQSLISVLRQLRAGFPTRSRDFPVSVALCGLRDGNTISPRSLRDPAGPRRLLPA